MSESTTRVLAEGQWLGTANRIIYLEYQRGRGWIAADLTGEKYCQRRAHRDDHVLADGLKTADEPQDCTRLPRTPWPKAPR
jgi:hypothetical protein